MTDIIIPPGHCAYTLMSVSGRYHRELLDFWEIPDFHMDLSSHGPAVEKLWCGVLSLSPFYFLFLLKISASFIGVGRCPGEQTVPELPDNSRWYLEPLTTVSVWWAAVIWTKQEVLIDYVTIREEVKHSVAEHSTITWLFAAAWLIYRVLKSTSSKHTVPLSLHEPLVLSLVSNPYSWTR